MVACPGRAAAGCGAASQGGDWPGRLSEPGVNGLYLHLPFCVRRCAYCDFLSRATEPGDPLMAAYARSLARQLDEIGKLGMLDPCETAYFGGGTPSLLGTSTLSTLVTVLREQAPRLVELSCEANPDSLGDELVASLKAAGVTRLSVGVQSLEDVELRRLGRVHDARTARGRVRAAEDADLDVSVDLMCAIPGQTDASWMRTLEGALALGPCHMSVYPLQVEEGTPLALELGDDEPPWNDPDVQAGRMEQAREFLEASGLRRYEVASYARDGKECRHNVGYWTGRPYLGLGEGASSMLTRAGYERLRLVCPQLPELDGDVARIRLTVTSGAAEIAAHPSLAGLRFELELLDERQACAEDLMLAMRMTKGVDGALMARAREAMPGSRLDAAVDGVVERGLATWQGGCLRPTDRGWLLGNELYGELWDLAGSEPRLASA